MLPDQPRLMIVDDDPVTCEMLCEVFAAEGFLSRFVQSGEAAVTLLADEPLDVLVSDIRMRTPFDGLALLDHVRQAYPSLPVVLMTAFGSVDTAVRAVKQKGVKKLAWMLPDVSVAEAAIEGAILGNYEPNMNKPSSDAKPLDSFSLVAPAKSAALDAALARGKILAESQNFARDLGNQPANLMTPTIIAMYSFNI